MHVECPKCGSLCRVADEALPEAGANLRCGSCTNVFFVAADAAGSVRVVQASASGNYPAAASAEATITGSLPATTSSPAMTGTARAMTGVYAAISGLGNEASTDAAQPALSSGSGPRVAIDPRLTGSTATLQPPSESDVVPPQGAWQIRGTDSMVFNFIDAGDVQIWLSRRDSHEGLSASNDGGKVWSNVADLPYFAKVLAAGKLGGRRTGVTSAIPRATGSFQSVGPRSGSAPALSGNAPAVTGAQPAVTGSQPKVSSSVLPVTSLGNTGAHPAVTGSNPRVTGAQPAVTGSNPRVTGSNPAITGSMPAIPVDKKAAAARQQAIFGLIARLVVLIVVVGAGYYAYDAMYAEEVLEIPNTPAGDKLRWTMAVFNQKRGEVTEDEILKNFSPEVTSKVTPAALVENFIFLGRQNGFYELISIEEGATDHSLIAVMRTTNLSLVELRITTENKPPFSFKSLAFEETKRRPKGSGFN
ncbi:MAG: zinc-ribbon domain-containing protein [Deltaproteobacteria bacterium]|nr:zinc-ribbon domain-containing protein [Deltaproteobacteria bacterium]